MNEEEFKRESPRFNEENWKETVKENEKLKKENQLLKEQIVKM